MSRAIFYRFFLSFSFLLALACVADAQDDSTKADESFTLDIKESRVSEANYERSTKVEIGNKQNDKGVTVGVGATVRAQNITITLRGITGNVRFRASLEAIRRVLERASPNEP